MMNGTVAPAPVPSQTARPARSSSPAALLFLFGCAVLWLFLAVLLGLRNSLNFHAPALFAAQSWLSYGRVHAAYNASLLFGFCVPCALGVGIWLFCRLGRASLAGPGVVLIAAIFWNFALALGVAAILCGGSTGYECFELPAWCAPILFISFLLIGLCAFETFHQRRPGALYPSQWFVAASLLWFPWIFSTAALLLLYVPARGVLQALMDWWFIRNFDTVFLGFAGLASAFYFVPKLLGRPLQSHYLAAMAFWSLALCGGCGGIPDGAPLPSWIISLGVVGTVFTAVPVLAVAICFFQTARNDLSALDANPTLRFTSVALFFWFIASVQQIVGAIPRVSVITDFTWFGFARNEMFHYGFFAMAVFGALYDILPRLLSLEPTAWRPKLLQAHFYLTFLGVLLSCISLMAAGVGQGLLLANSANAFPDVMRRAALPLRVSTMGELFLVLGTFLFLLNFALLLRTAWRERRRA
jgi:cytochrome c oxidase cbb3-type subunit 1